MEVPSQIHEAMVAHARFCLPEEACGLLAGDETGRLRMAYALTNIDHSSGSYTVDPVEHYRSLRHAERHGWRLAGVFHSHPRSEPYPSETDVARALEPGWLYAIVGGGWTADPEVRAFRISDGRIAEEPLEVVP